MTLPRSTLVLALTLPLVAAAAYRAGAADKPDTRFFELRKYTTKPGRMDALKTRFRDHTNKYFAKHGATPIGFWQAASGPDAENTLIYVLAYPSREAREATWKAFSADPGWKQAFADSEKTGKIVDKAESTYLVPTDFSALR